MDSNLGSIELVGIDKQCYTDGKTRYRREYQGFSQDFDKLPVSDDMAAGSCCLFLDNGAYAQYHAGTKTWKRILQGSLGGAGTGGQKGEDGKSAYQSAVELGFEGTEEEWIASLKGKDGIGAGFEFVQAEPSDTWTITHSLGYRYPNVVCADEYGNGISGSIQYVSDSVAVIRFETPVSGSAHLSYGGGAGVSEGNYLKVEVMDRSEYEALSMKDSNTLYMLRG